MNKKIVWLVVSCVMVLALLAASCAKAAEKAPAPATKEAAPVVKEAAPAVKEAAPAVKEAAPAVKEAAPVVKEAAPAEAKEMVKVTLTKVDGTTMEKMVEKPQYGGQFIYALNRDVLGFDEGFLSPPWFCDVIGTTNQDLMIGDFYRSRAGTGENSFIPPDWLNMAYVKGDLAESWELPDDTTIIYHIRKGVKWSLNPNSAASRLVNGREFTADDAVFNLKRIYIDMPTATMYGMAGSARPTEVYATDKYTVVVKATKGMLGQTLFYTGSLVKIVPPEVVKKYGHMNDWENVVGTGAFILTDYVPMSSAAYVRNPNYWEYDPILGKDYPLPYLDGIKYLVIKDTSTQLAAHRTGKVDHSAASFTLDDAQPLMKSNPELIYLKVPPAGCSPLGFREDKPELPFDDIRVRRALSMGINYREIVDTYYRGEAEIITYKVHALPAYKDAGWYTELKDLPAETRELYEYNPDKAKQLLAEAGYPNGFKTEVVLPGAYANYTDLMEMAKSYWAKIGVDLTLDVKELGVHQSIYQRKTHKEGLLWGRGADPTCMFMNRKGNIYNWAMMDDPKIDDYYYPQVAAAFFDPPKKNKLMKEVNLYLLSRADYYCSPRGYTYVFWQPWLKNHAFFGSVVNSIAAWSPGEPFRYLWIDQELKKAMGR